MIIRQAREGDISQMVELDRVAYGSYGETEEYFKQKLSEFNTKILIGEQNDQILGFCVFELLNPGQELLDFTDLKLDSPITGKWTHIIAFTTQTNYLDIGSDTKLLKEVENLVKRLGYHEIYVPLSINHPFLSHDVFGFWEKNAYHKVGTIKWVASPAELIDCYFYRKNAND